MYKRQLEETKKLIPLLERFDKKEYYAVMTSWLPVSYTHLQIPGGDGLWKVAGGE